MKTILTLLCTAALVLPACVSDASPIGAEMFSAKSCRDSRGRFTKCPAPTQTCPARATSSRGVILSFRRRS